uniref:PS II complex 12 kDa extrinsic protein n=1 Tax=Steinernema glaseri TaxID=37863 RepID=A0A1I8A0W8_9BILA
MTTYAITQGTSVFVIFLIFGRPKMCTLTCLTLYGPMVLEEKTVIRHVRIFLFGNSSDGRLYDEEHSQTVNLQKYIDFSPDKDVDVTTRGQTCLSAKNQRPYFGDKSANSAMRLLPILWCLLATACSYSVDRNHATFSAVPLRGKELFKTITNMSPEDVDEVARIIAEDRGEVDERVNERNSAIYKQNSIVIDEAKEYVEGLENMRLPLGDRPPSITEINMRLGLDEVLIEGDIIMTP